MPAEYKRKRLAEDWALDMPSKKLGYRLEGAERQRAKREIESQNERAYTRSELEFEVRVMTGNECWDKECAAKVMGRDYKCECVDPRKMTTKELKKYLGLL